MMIAIMTQITGSTNIVPVAAMGLALVLAGCVRPPPNADALPPPSSLTQPSAPTLAPMAQPVLPPGPISSGAGISVPPPMPSASSRYDTVFAPYQGQNASTLQARLGPPASQDSVAGRVLMHWKQANANGYSCELQAEIDSHNEIQRGTWNGSDQGCDDLANQMQ